MIRATLTAAGFVALALMASAWQDARRDARESIHDGQTPAALCGDICRPTEPTDWCGDLPPVYGDDC
ncbi:MAG: hypothetical protein AB7F22_25580 [Reyranella sp.]|uniref:hypothetical protein n=1 Tax=Reyranella sp. TaxID=1929291 RepID=UPI003D129C36